MKVEKRVVSVYKVQDKDFTNKDEAIAYEKECNEKLSRTYYVVYCKPDLTEGRGFYTAIIVGVEPTYFDNALIQFLCDKLGQPIVRVMGVAPTENWSVSEPYKFDNMEKLNKFLDNKRVVGLGDYVKEEKLELYLINQAGQQE